MQFIFTAFVYTCVSILGPFGDLASKTCEWRSHGGFYASEEACVRDLPTIGHEVHEFSIVLNARRRVEKVRCDRNPVID